MLCVRRSWDAVQRGIGMLYSLGPTCYVTHGSYIPLSLILLLVYQPQRELCNTIYDDCGSLSVVNCCCTDLEAIRANQIKLYFSYRCKLTPCCMVGSSGFRFSLHNPAEHCFQHVQSCPPLVLSSTDTGHVVFQPSVLVWTSSTMLIRRRDNRRSHCVLEIKG